MQQEKEVGLKATVDLNRLSSFQDRSETRGWQPLQAAKDPATSLHH